MTYAMPCTHQQTVVHQGEQWPLQWVCGERGNMVVQLQHVIAAGVLVESPAAQVKRAPKTQYALLTGGNGR